MSARLINTLICKMRYFYYLLLCKMRYGLARGRTGNEVMLGTIDAKDACEVEEKDRLSDTP